MPASLEAAFVVLVLLAPGFLLQRGFQRGGTHAVPSLSLYAVIQAVVLSGVILLASAPLGGFTIARWLNAGTLTEHEWAAWAYFLALLTVPFFVGLLIGRVTQSVVSPGGGQLPPAVKTSWAGRSLLGIRTRFQGAAIQDWLGWLGFMTAPTAWDRAWMAIAEKEAPVMVEVDVGDEAPLFAVFADQSFVTTSPQPHGVFLEAEYVESGDTLEEVPLSEGVFVEGSQIRSLSFFRHVPVEEQLWEEGPDSGDGNAGSSRGESPAV